MWDRMPNLVADVHARCPRAAASWLHGDAHWRAVAAAGLRLIDEGSPADAELLVLFALLHDSHRVNDDVDPQHGARAAAFARELQAHGALDLGPERLDQLAQACEFHTGGSTDDDPTIGTCWDADRLNLPRVGIAVDPTYLSTPQARRHETIHWATTLHDAPPSWNELVSLSRPRSG